MIRKFRPFWSYDVLKTEKWLNQMSLSGYHLKHINFKLRTFSFEQGESINVHYRTCYEKRFSGQISHQLIENGWESVILDKHFYVLMTSNDNPLATPSYSGVLERNRKIQRVAGIILLILICMQIPMALILGFVLFEAITGKIAVKSGTTFPHSPPSPLSGLAIALVTIINLAINLVLSPVVFIWLIYTFFKLRASNKRIELLSGEMPQLSFTIPKEGLMTRLEEKALLESGAMVKKMKIAWQYAPDRLEQWLEAMELQGFNLYRMNKLGIRFYFIKGKPRQMKYAVDFQKNTNPTYFNLNKECGWNLIFTSPWSSMQTMTVWSQAYSEDGIVPEFYSDAQSRIHHAKKIAITYSLIFFTVCILFIGLIILELSMWNIKYHMPWHSILLQTIIIIEFGYFALRTILFYFRVKKNERDRERC
jgi:hypothetical protein